MINTPRYAGAIIDAHCHVASTDFIPVDFVAGTARNIAAKLQATGVERSIGELSEAVRKQHQDHHADGLIGELDESGVAQAVLLLPDFTFVSRCDLTIAEMLTHVADSHASVESKALSEYFGVAPVGLRLRLIEKQPVITQVLDPEAVKAGVRTGDIVKKVDGETILDRFKREAQYVAASTPQALGAALMTRILNGPEGSMAMLTIEDAIGNRKDVSVTRSTSFRSGLAAQRDGETMKLLPGNIGYADLEHLKASDVDSMFEKFRSTKAIVFDARGPSGDAAAGLATRLTHERDAPVAVFTGPLTMNPDVPQSGITTHTSSYFFVQTIPNSSEWKYNNKTVLLIDERTIDQAEHTGLFLEAANKTAFIGSSSAGADGDVNEFVVPGGVTIRFSARDVRNANGGKLQRLGLQPSVSVSPTIKGVRDGRDEVLEKALEYLAKPQ